MTDQDELSSIERLQLLLEANQDPEVTMVAVPKSLLHAVISDWAKAMVLADQLIATLQQLIEEAEKLK